MKIEFRNDKTYFCFHNYCDKTNKTIQFRYSIHIYIIAFKHIVIFNEKQTIPQQSTSMKIAYLIIQLLSFTPNLKFFSSSHISVS